MEKDVETETGLSHTQVYRPFILKNVIDIGSVVGARSKHRQTNKHHIIVIIVGMIA